MPPILTEQVRRPPRLRQHQRGVATALAAFEPKLMRPAVMREARGHARLADLAVTFPAALAAIATADRGARADVARQLVMSGAALKTVADALGVPMWLRRLPPSAFTKPIRQWPDTPTFCHRISNHWPKLNTPSAVWCEWVQAAAAAGGEHLALWAAREFNLQRHWGDAAGFGSLGLYFWYSQRPELEAARFLSRRFTPSMTLESACEAVDDWLQRIQFAFLPLPVFRSGGFSVAEVDDYLYRRIETFDGFLGVGERMSNCLTTYAGCVSDRDQVWTVSRHGKLIAALEMQLASNGDGVPKLQQLLAHNNEEPPAAVVAATYRFLLQWPISPRQTPLTGNVPPTDNEAYRRLFKPYWLARGRAPWMPFDLGKDGGLHGLLRDLNALRHPRRCRCHRRRRPRQ